MLNARKKRQSGFSLIELMVGVVILGVLATIAAPNFQTWTQNSKIRNATESIMNGMQLARAQAVARNRLVEFNLTADTSWTVRTLAVGSAVSEVLGSRAGSEGSKNVTFNAVASDMATAATAITYNNFGGVGTNEDGSPPLAQIDLAVDGGSRNLRVVIGMGGIARMCDPHAMSGSLSAC
jgi:type IV fimbrial biogenesis protein FimT